jgi:hypothetical protein
MFILLFPVFPVPQWLIQPEYSNRRRYNARWLDACNPTPQVDRTGAAQPHRSARVSFRKGDCYGRLNRRAGARLRAHNQSGFASANIAGEV